MQEQKLESSRFLFAVSLPLWLTAVCLIASLSLFLLGFYMPYWFILQSFPYNPIFALSIPLLFVLIVYTSTFVFLYSHTSLNIYETFIQVRKIYGLYRRRLDFDSVESFYRFERARLFGFIINFKESKNPKNHFPPAPLALPFQCTNLDKLEKLLEKNYVAREAD